MDVNEKAVELLKRAENVGMRVDFDSGFLTVELTDTDDPENQRAILEALMQSLPEVRRLTEVRAMAVRAKEFLGKKILSFDGTAMLEKAGGYGDGKIIAIVKEGTLAGIDDRGGLTVSIVSEGRSQRLTSKAEDLLVVLEGAAGASSPQNDKPAAERRGLLDRFRRSPRED
jgi:hypothetical protein